MRIRITRAFSRADIEEVHGRHYDVGEYQVIDQAPMGRPGLVSEATAKCAVENGWGAMVEEPAPATADEREAEPVPSAPAARGRGRGRRGSSG